MSLGTSPLNFLFFLWLSLVFFFRLCSSCVSVNYQQDVGFYLLFLLFSLRFCNLHHEAALESLSDVDTILKEKNSFLTSRHHKWLLMGWCPPAHKSTRILSSLMISSSREKNKHEKELILQSDHTAGRRRFSPKMKWSCLLWSFISLWVKYKLLASFITGFLGIEVLVVSTINALWHLELQTCKAAKPPPNLRS